MKRKIKILIDVLMTGFLLFQMSYSLIGEDRHKWHGIVLLILFALHNTLNCGFYKGLLRGKYGPFRIFQMLLAFLAVLSMAGAMISGLSMALGMMKKKVPVLQTKAGRSSGRWSNGAESERMSKYRYGKISERCSGGLYPVSWRSISTRTWI